MMRQLFYQISLVNVALAFASTVSALPPPSDLKAREKRNLAATPTPTPTPVLEPFPATQTRERNAPLFDTAAPSRERIAPRPETVRQTRESNAPPSDTAASSRDRKAPRPETIQQTRERNAPPSGTAASSRQRTTAPRPETIQQTRERNAPPSSTAASSRGRTAPRAEAVPQTRERTTTTREAAPQERPSTIVVIDAGHGGFDRGGIPRQRVAEKTMTLDVALRLRTILEASGYRTVMTRSTDVFIPLPTRAAIANSYRNAIFVCIHFNSAPRSGADGIETYFYSRESLPLASAIHYHVAGGAPSPNRGVRRRGFYVLRKTRIPAILVECGFLTNPRESNYIQTTSYRQKLAEEIARGIRGRTSVVSTSGGMRTAAAGAVPLQPFIDQTRMRESSRSKKKSSKRRSSKSKSSKSGSKKKKSSNEESAPKKKSTSKKAEG